MLKEGQHDQATPGGSLNGEKQTRIVLEGGCGPKAVLQAVGTDLVPPGSPPRQRHGVRLKRIIVTAIKATKIDSRG